MKWAMLVVICLLITALFVSGCVKQKPVETTLEQDTAELDQMLNELNNIEDINISIEEGTMDDLDEAEELI